MTIKPRSPRCAGLLVPGLLAVGFCFSGHDTHAQNPRGGRGPATTLLAARSNPLVAFRFVFRAGSQSDPVGKEGLAALTAAMVAEGGTRSRTYEQVLAAFYPMAATPFGFLVAVVLYQMQSFVLSVRERFGKVSDDWAVEPNDWDEAQLEENWSRIADMLSTATLHKNYHKQPDDWKQTRERFRNDFIKRVRMLESIKKGMMWSLKVTGITISVSLILVMLTPFLWLCASYFFLVTTVAATIYCLATYFPLIRDVTKQTPTGASTRNQRMGTTPDRTPN